MKNQRVFWFCLGIFFFLSVSIGSSCSSESPLEPTQEKGTEVSELIDGNTAEKSKESVQVKEEKLTSDTTLEKKKEVPPTEPIIDTITPDTHEATVEPLLDTPHDGGSTDKGIPEPIVEAAEPIADNSDGGTTEPIADLSDGGTTEPIADLSDGGTTEPIADLSDGGPSEPVADGKEQAPPEVIPEGSAALCSATPPTKVIDVSVQQLYKLIQAKTKLAVVDVREPSETMHGVIAGALLYPWFGGKLKSDHKKLPVDRPLYVICASGGRSYQASDFLFKNGHQCIYNVTGGMGAWLTAKYPTTKPKP